MLRKIILDNAHGEDTPGKRSPNGEHREYLWSRNFNSRLAESLRAEGFDVIINNVEDEDISLAERVRRANSVPGKNLFISNHNNAGGMGDDWYNARGFSVYTTRGETKSDILAEIFYQEYESTFPGLKTRRDESDGDADQEANFAVIRGANCPAVLIEWLFQDNKEDVRLLNDEDWLSGAVQLSVNAIKRFMEEEK